MSLICIAVFDTIENRRTELTEQTLISLKQTVDFSRHRLVVIDNDSCEATKKLLREFNLPKTVITNTENEGTARAINKGFRLRRDKEFVCKMDNDVLIYTPNAFDLLEEAVGRMPDTIGICCAKRKDLLERPDVEGWAKSELKMLPQKAGERNLIIEIVNHAMGTLQCYNYRLIDKMGGLQQFGGLYGYDDSLSAVRAHKLGYLSCFLHGIEIDHLDVQGDDGGYTKWKQEYAGERMNKFFEVRKKIESGELNVYEPI